MKSHKRINSMVVCLDLTRIDRHLMTYALFLGTHVHVKDIWLLHVIQAYDLSGSRESELQELRATVVRTLEKQIQEYQTDSASIRIVVEIERENASRHVVDFANAREADLVVLGKKFGADRDARYSAHIASDSSADLLFVPENPKLSADRILCAIDFSSASKRAFAKALHVRESAGSQLSCYYLFDASRSYFPAATLRTSASLEQKLRKKAAAFLDDFGLTLDDIPCRIILGDPTATHEKLITQQPSDLIILGAKGRVGNVTSLLGHAAESFRKSDIRTPVMVVRDR